MKRFYAKLNYFSNAEKVLWTASVCLIVGAYIAFGSRSPLNLVASLIGVTSLLFAAKGNPIGMALIGRSEPGKSDYIPPARVGDIVEANTPIGMALMIAFSALYGYISFTFRYYGEMITYLGMTMPMSLWSLIAWLSNPYRGNRAQVQVNAKLKRLDWVLLVGLTAAVTAAFYFILRALDTAYLPISTLSVATSFSAVFLTARRSPYYAVAYACNDIVLIVLWVLASQADQSYIGVAICFLAFLLGDIYGFINWKRMERRQRN